MPTMHRRRTKHRYRPIVTYDIETTRIEAGTPTPLYISTFDGENVSGFSLDGLESLQHIVINHMLTEDNRKKRFVGYNSNRFDAPIIALAMMNNPNYIVEPWLTKSGNFRGMAIRSSENHRTAWHFSDAMSMFGYQGSLSSFLSTFAPEHHKGSIDILNFDSTNLDHRTYAENDSVSLWHAVTNAANNLYNATGIPPQNTIGKTAILYFESKMPNGVEVRGVPYSAERPLRYAKRGGYVHCAGRFKGNVWKYDINQAYASVMRNPLPAGRCISTKHRKVDKLGLYLCTIFRYNKSPVPFYIRDETGKPITTCSEITTGWILSPEIDYLQEYGWDVVIHKGWYWSEQFDMAEMVNELEHNRITCDGGPKGPMGTIYKFVGNNAYGKTLEEHDGIRLVYTSNPPDEYHAYMAEDDDYDNIWFTKEEPKPETYHKPQIGIFITAYVRLHIMRTAQLSPSTFLYADTDCIAFVSNMTNRIDIDPGRYGAYKIEADGEVYGFINKKVYYSLQTVWDEEHKMTRAKTASSKGIHPREVSFDMFELWYQGKLPSQRQTQKQSVTKMMAGSAMFVERDRTGSFVLPYFDSS